MLIRIKKAQSTLEYALLIGVVVGALLYMQNYLKRSIQGRLQDAADQIGDQYSPSLTFRNEVTYVKVPHQLDNTTWHIDSNTTTFIDQDASQNTFSTRKLEALDKEKWTSTGGASVRP